MNILSFFMDSRACGRAAGQRRGLRQGCRAAAGLWQSRGKVAAGLPGLVALGFGQAGPSQARPSAEPRPTGRQGPDLGGGRGAGALDVHKTLTSEFKQTLKQQTYPLLHSFAIPFTSCVWVGSPDRVLDWGFWRRRRPIEKATYF